MFGQKSFRRLLTLLLGFCFAAQVLVAVPAHAFHGAEHQAKISFGKTQNHDGKEQIPDDCRCDLCLAFNALDTASVAKPPVFALTETAFSVVAAYSSFEYSHPLFFAQARGPPTLS